MRSPLCVAGIKVKYKDKQYIVANISYDKRYDEFIYYLVKAHKYNKSKVFGPYDEILPEEVFEKDVRPIA